MSRGAFRLLMFAVAAFGLWLTFSQPHPPAPRSGGQANPSAASPAAQFDGVPGHRFRFRDIETVRVGDRVVAHNPERDPAARAPHVPEPDWSGCSVARLEMARPAMSREGGRGGTAGDRAAADATLKIDLLRPDDWFRQRLRLVVVADPHPSHEHAPPTVAPPPTVSPPLPATRLPPATPLRPLDHDLALASGLAEAHIGPVAALALELDLPEMGVSGTAIVVSLDPAPPIPGGAGSVVTGTFAHPPQGEVLDVRFEGEADTIGVTANHLFWSDDHGGFVPIGRLDVGSRVRTVGGQSRRIVSLLPRPGPAEVYNLEVYGEHVYFVGRQGFLVHNSYVGDLGEKAAKGWLKRHGYTDVLSIQNRSRHGIDLTARHADGTLTFFEVKTSTTARAPRLTQAQRDPERFVRTRLERAAKGERWWTNTSMPVRDSANSMLLEQSIIGNARYYLIEITNATIPDTATQLRLSPW